jgi:hypothetical protein
MTYRPPPASQSPREAKKPKKIWEMDARYFEREKKWRHVKVDKDLLLIFHFVKIPFIVCETRALP